MATAARGPAGKRRRGRRGVRAVAVLVLGYLVALALNRSQVEVAGPSMEPSLWPGDRLLTLPALPRALRIGQVVVVRDPAAPDHLVIKRVRAIHAGQVTVLGDSPDRSTDSRTWGPLPVSAVRRIAVCRWPDVFTPLRRLPESAAGDDRLA